MCNLPRILTSPIAVTAQPSQPIGLIDTSWSNDTCLASTASENSLSSYQVHKHKSSAPESPYRTASWLCGCRCFPGSAESLMICVLLMRVLRTLVPITISIIIQAKPDLPASCLPRPIVAKKRSQGRRLGFTLFAWTRMPRSTVRVRHLDLFG